MSSSIQIGTQVVIITRSCSRGRTTSNASKSAVLGALNISNSFDNSSRDNSSRHCGDIYTTTNNNTHSGSGFSYDDPAGDRQGRMHRESNPDTARESGRSAWPQNVESPGGAQGVHPCPSCVKFILEQLAAAHINVTAVPVDDDSGCSVEEDVDHWHIVDSVSLKSQSIYTGSNCSSLSCFFHVDLAELEPSGSDAQSHPIATISLGSSYVDLNTVASSQQRHSGHDTPLPVEEEVVESLDTSPSLTSGSVLTSQEDQPPPLVHCENRPTPTNSTITGWRGEPSHDVQAGRQRGHSVRHSPGYTSNREVLPVSGLCAIGRRHTIGGNPPLAVPISDLGSGQGKMVPLAGPVEHVTVAAAPDLSDFTGTPRQIDARYKKVLYSSPDPALAVTWIQAILELQSENNNNMTVVKAFLEPRPQEAERLLGNLSSLICVNDERTAYRIIDQSLLHFLSSPERCGDLFVSHKEVTSFLQGRWLAILKNKGPQISLVTQDRQFFLRQYVDAFTMRYFYPAGEKNYTRSDVTWWKDTCLDLLSPLERQRRVASAQEIAHEPCRRLFPCTSDCKMWRLNNMSTPA